MDTTVNIPSNFCCPITLELMKNPVICTDGHTYERDAIENWLKIKKTSPMTNKVILNHTLIPNYNLKSQIELFKDNQKKNGTNENKNNPIELKEKDKLDFYYSCGKRAFPCIKDPGFNNEALLNKGILTIVPPNPKTSNKLYSLVCIIDISGSMNTKVTTQDDQGNKSTTGHSILDIVKYTLHTIIKTLNKNCKFSIVTFSSYAEVLFNLLPMTDENKKIAIEKLNSLEAQGSTNLWDGLKCGINILNNSGDKERISSIFLLTDGEPTDHPDDNDYIESYKYFMKDKNINFNLNTFGFGYSLYSKLLYDLACVGGGTFAFIPDGSMIATIFIHALSNFLATYMTNVTIELSSGEKKEIIKLNSIQYGQNRDLLIDLVPNIDTPAIKVKYNVLQISEELDMCTTQENEMALIRGPSRTSQEGAVPLGRTSSNVLGFFSKCLKRVTDFNVEDNINILQDNDFFTNNFLYTKKVLDTLESFVLNSSDLTKIISKNYLIHDNELNKYDPHNIVTIVSLLEINNKAAIKKDLSEQVSIALSNKEYYEKWGIHYLRSLICTYKLQQCNNFKDQGMKEFGKNSYIFIEERENAKRIFMNNSLPPPTYKQASSDNMAVGSCKTSYKNYILPKYVPVSSSTFLNENGGCFYKDCQITMYNGSQKYVSDVIKGDKVKTPNSFGIIRCVLEITLKDMFKIMKINKLLITPWHPIFDINSHRWVFPNNIGTIEPMYNPIVYSFLLENNETGENIVYIEDIPCVTLAGHYKGDIREHPFWGTNEIIYELQKINGFDDGFVKLSDQ